MFGSGDRAYAYTKACGIIGKSYIGKGIHVLEQLNRLSELQRLIQSDMDKDSCDIDSISQLEHAIIERCMNSLLSIVSSLSRPPELIILLLRAQEFNDLKSCLNSIAASDPLAPDIHAIPMYARIHFNAYPNLDSMLADSGFEWILPYFKDTIQHGPGPETLRSIFIKIDQQYYSDLCNALGTVPESEISGFRKLLEEEIQLKNASWVLRLHSYYSMTGDDIKPYLLGIPGKTCDGVEEALASIDYPHDQKTDWKTWKWEKFLNPELPGTMWKLDPRYFQNAASLYIYKKTRRLFRRKPLSLDSLAAFIRLKQFEEDLLIGVAEGLSMGMSGKESLSMMEVRP